MIRAAERHLVRGREAFPPHLALLGALGRLLAVSGDAPRALEYQMEAARGFLERMDRESVSFPLTEWYRLAGALDDHSAFDAAETVRQTVEALGGVGPGQPYVELGPSQGADGVDDRRSPGRGDDPRAARRDRAMPSHIRWAAVRWHVRLLEESGRDAATVLARLDAAETRDRRGGAARAPVPGCSIDLDRAGRRQDTARARRPSPSSSAWSRASSATSAAPRRRAGRRRRSPATIPTEAGRSP